MEAEAAKVDPDSQGWLTHLPRWVLAVIPLVFVGVAVGAFAALGAPGLTKRIGPPAEELAIERTVLRPGQIELTVRNDGPDRVQVAQVLVNDAFAGFTGAESAIGHLRSEKITVEQSWVEGEAYEIALLTSSGGTITHEIAAAVETPQANLGFYGLMALLGIYVGVIPIALGMFWLPWMRRIPSEWMRLVMALTVGLLVFLAIDATLEGFELAGEGAQAFGGVSLVLLGAIAAFIVLSGVDQWLRRRSDGDGKGSPRISARRMATLVAIGIGLHNLGEGLAIGSAYTSGALALGAFLVVGFALHNTTEGFAIAAPISSGRTSIALLASLGLVAGLPAVFGAWIGASAVNTSLVAFLFGVGAGAIVQVIVTLSPALRNQTGRLLHPAAVAGLLAGLGLMFATSLLVTA